MCVFLLISSYAFLQKSNHTSNRDGFWPAHLPLELLESLGELNCCVRLSAIVLVLLAAEEELREGHAIESFLHDSGDEVLFPSDVLRDLVAIDDRLLECCQFADDLR